jgi:hypothetical protein
MFQQTHQSFNINQKNTRFKLNYFFNFHGIMKIKIKCSLKCVFCWFTLYDYVTMHVAKNTKNAHQYLLQTSYIAVPLQAWNGPEGSRKSRFPDFMTTAQDGGKVVSLTHQPPLLPENTPGTHFC